eukprot:g482.t1
MTGTGGLPSKAARQTSLHNHRTPNNVGPGSYGSVAPVAPPPSYAGFASTDRRTLNPNKGTSAITPGPGSYSIAADEQPSAPAQSNAFKTRVSRFAPVAPGSSVYKASTIAQNPGPGAYGELKVSSAPMSTRPKKPELMVKAARTKPSIPRREQSYGYQEGKNRQLVLQGPTETVYSGLGGDTVGPAMYNPDVKLTKAGQLKTNWAASNQVRKLWEPNKTRENWRPSGINPGPGQYNPSFPTMAPKVADDELSRCTSNFASRVPMAHESAAKETLPAPGIYNPYTSSAVEEKYKASKSRMQGFGTRAERKGWARNMDIPFSTPSYQLNPGPGTYGEKRTAFNKQPRKMLVEEPIGFGGTATRPCMAPTKVPTSNVPGPGAYLSGSSIGTITNGISHKAGVGRNGIFGSTSHRFSHGIFDEMEGPEGMEAPGPGTFEMVPPDSFEAQAAAPIAAPTTDVAARRVQQGVFKSRSRRFGDRRPRPDHASLGIDEPEPYLINLPSQFDQKPEPPGAREKKGPFASTAVRFDGKNFMGKKVEKTPGPGTYGKSVEQDSTFTVKPALRRPLAPPGTISMDARFKPGQGSFVNAVTPGAIGPGSYNTGGTMQKKSYNIMMAAK